MKELSNIVTKVNGGRRIGAGHNRQLIRIGDRLIGDGEPTFVVAEIGVNHNGDLQLAKEMAQLAKDCGADCVKFQMRSLRSLYANHGDPDDFSQDVGVQYVLDVLAHSQLSCDDMLKVFDHCRSIGILPLCTPWDLESVETLQAYGLAGYKIASADLTNHELLARAVRTGRPLLVSTGMSTEQEIEETVALLNRLRAEFALLHCISTYPAPHKDLNLRYLERLKNLGCCPVGYSGHERGFYAVLAAVACGASIIEKHFTIDKSLPGNDHKISLLPHEFHEMVRAVRDTEAALGGATPRVLGQGERINRENLAKSLVAAVDVPAGEVIRGEMVTAKSPGKGLQPNRRAALIGRVARRSIPKGGCFFESDLHDQSIEARRYGFQRRWGVPVRYHDYQRLLQRSNMDLLEFHLTFKDLAIPIRQMVRGRFEFCLAVHAPDLLANDCFFDPANESAQIVKASEEALRRCIDITQELAEYFIGDRPPLLIINAGGYSKESPLPPEERPRLYQKLAERLERLSAPNLEIITQTMPPFPWLFGGQQFANLFLDPEETTRFCAGGRRLCLDLSHSKLASNQRGVDFNDDLTMLAPFAAHVHLVDAAGTDNEGLQIDEGEIDFPAAIQILDRLAPHASFVPEIWQGHKNDGEGFWIALDRLERYFSHSGKEVEASVAGS